MQKIDAQSDSYCGLTYYYNSAGDRIQRSISSCEIGGDTRMVVVMDSTATDTTNQLTEALYPNPTGGNSYESTVVKRSKTCKYLASI